MTWMHAYMYILLEMNVAEHVCQSNVHYNRMNVGECVHATCPNWVFSTWEVCMYVWCRCVCMWVCACAHMCVLAHVYDLLWLKGNAIGDGGLDAGYRLGHDVRSLLVVEAPDEGTHRPFDNSGEAEGNEAQSGAHHLAAAWVIVSAALDTHGYAHGDPRHPLSHMHSCRRPPSNQALAEKKTQRQCGSGRIDPCF